MFSLFVLSVGQINRCLSRYFCPQLYIHVLTMAAAFQVILEADQSFCSSLIGKYYIKTCL